MKKKKNNLLKCKTLLKKSKKMKRDLNKIVFMV